jgi:uncharacterized protein YecT (DUF1311 family)
MNTGGLSPAGMETAHDEKNHNRRDAGIGAGGCAQTQAPKEDSRLKEAYSACINTAEGSPEKIEACQSVLNVLKKRKRMSSSQRRKTSA